MITPPPFPSSSSPASNWRYHAGMLLASFLVATSFPVGKTITPFMDSGALNAIRFLLATVLFAPYVHRKFGIRFPGIRGVLRYSLLSACLAGFFWLTFIALRYTDPLHTGALFTITPGLAGIFSWFLLGEKAGTSRILALLLALFGALWVILSGDLSRLIAMSFNQGDLIFLGACLCMALYGPLIRLLHRDEPMAVMTFWTMATGAFWLFLFSTPALITCPWAQIPEKVWVGIVYLAIFTTIVTFFITQWATLGLGPTRVTAYSYLYPPLVILINLGLGQGLPPLKTLIGVAIILPAMVLIQKEDKSIKHVGV
ncbi:DMT family transporter [Desulfosarcina sp. OttesenSCG-928-A07]|nr:DMT family transporter [Desulfosarcina sp. OttesenSCG-928-G17]MDL2328638.1 DMT family transporter [Desulfosarcina sp. OttesenSCG-928-A07]